MSRQARDEYQDLRLKAEAKTRYAIKTGLIKKLDGSIPCVDCGGIATMYDHRDYTKPLAVDPVCRTCNSKRGASIQKPEGWYKKNGTRWGNLGGGAGDEYIDTAKLSIDINIDQLYETHCALPDDRDPEVLIAMKELSRFTTGYVSEHKVLSYNGETRTLDRTYSKQKKAYVWDIQK